MAGRFYRLLGRMGRQAGGEEGEGKPGIVDWTSAAVPKIQFLRSHLARTPYMDRGRKKEIDISSLHLVLSFLSLCSLVRKPPPPLPFFPISPHHRSEPLYSLLVFSGQIIDQRRLLCTKYI